MVLNVIDGSYMAERPKKSYKAKTKHNELKNHAQMAHTGAKKNSYLPVNHEAGYINPAAVPGLTSATLSYECLRWHICVSLL